MRLTVIGMAIGLVAGFAITRLLASLFFGVSRTNPLLYLAVCALMAAIAAVACYLPARAAVRVDPVRALRAE
jgi:ABC-type antimicrobial peptide transport system permease subunit